MLHKQCEAAALYESRWTVRALRRVDAELCDAIEDQLSMFHESLFRGTDKEITNHGEAMCRGWAAAIARMEHEQEPDDAYMLGQDGGTIVAISDQRSANARVRDLHGDRVMFITPDEVAAMVVGLQDIAKVKALWPGAEIINAGPKRIERYPDEPAQEDE